MRSASNQLVEHSSTRQLSFFDVLLTFAVLHTYITQVTIVISGEMSESIFWETVEAFGRQQQGPVGELLVQVTMRRRRAASPSRCV